MKLTRNIIVPRDELGSFDGTKWIKVPSDPKFLSFHPSQEEDRLVIMIFFFS